MVGNNHYGTISNSYAAGGSVTAEHSFSKLAGYDYGTISGAFWLCNGGRLGSCDDPKAKTAAQMQTKHTFLTAGWDFVEEDGNGSDDIWRMCDDGVDYPRLWLSGWGRFFSQLRYRRAAIPAPQLLGRYRKFMEQQRHSAHL